MFANPVYLGLRSFAAEAPLLTFMLLGGAVADRVDRRRILLTSQVLQMTFAASLAALYAFGRLGIAAILTAAFLTGLAQSQSAPTYQAVITSLVPPRQIQNAVALNSLQFNLSRAIGPAIAGVLLARVGVGACLAVNALSFVAVIVAIWSIELPAPASTGESLGRSLGTGLRHVWASRGLRQLTLLAAAGSFFAFPLITYLPTLATGAAGYSMLLSSLGVGAIGGAIATAHRGNVPGRERRLLLAFVIFGTSAAGAVLARTQMLAMALLFVAGWSMVTGFSTLNALVQESAPDALRGRVLSIYGLFFRGGGPVGGLVAGFVAARVGVRPVLVTYCLAIVALAAWGWSRPARAGEA
jgi:predicted MFS family arabinose efflux permease